MGLSNFLTLQTFGATQNHLLRTNHSGRALPVSTPVGNSFPTLRSPCLCALSVKFPFPTSLFIATFAQETGLVAQGAAPVAGPEAFSLCRRVRRSGDCKHLSVLNAAHTKIAPATLAESALPFLLDLKVFGISTYKKLFQGHP